MLDACGKPEFAPFANHLAFLGKHRGMIETDDAGIWIRGAGAGLTTWTPGPATIPPAPECQAVRLGPWSQPQWPSWLTDNGFREAERLAYMELASGNGHCPADGPIEIGIARSEAAALAFAAVQRAGFATGDVQTDSWWAECFRTVALRNRLDPQQTFYLGLWDGQPACTTLVLRAAGVAGIYAVATRPDCRCHGLARALLARACADAASQGIVRIILQAMQGSYAHAYYARLGFACREELPVWRKA